MFYIQKKLKIHLSLYLFKEGEESGMNKDEMNSAVLTLFSLDKKLNASVHFLRERKQDSALNAALKNSHKLESHLERIKENNTTNTTNARPSASAAQPTQNQNHVRVIRDFLVRSNFEAEGC